MTKFHPSQKFTKVNIAKVPKNKAIIYKIKSQSGDNIYTGIAGRSRPQERLLEHKKFKKDAIPGGVKFQYAQAKTKALAHKIEKSIIRKEKPRFNIQHK